MSRLTTSTPCEWAGGTVRPRVFVRFHTPELGDPLYIDAELIEGVVPGPRDEWSGLTATIALAQRPAVHVRETPEQVMQTLMDALNAPQGQT